MNNLTKEWKSKLSFLKDELQYIYIKLSRLNNEISISEKYNYVESFTEQVKDTILEVDAKKNALNIDGYTELNEAAFRDSLKSYEKIKEKYEAIIGDDHLLETV